MKLAIIPDDSMVIVDGEARTVDLAGLVDPNIHAVQWDETVGTVEWKTPRKVETITSVGAFSRVVAAWKAAAPAPVVEPAPTDDQRRLAAKPDFETQLDALWALVERAGLVTPDGAAAEGSPEKVSADVDAANARFPRTI